MAAAPLLTGRRVRPGPRLRAGSPAPTAVRTRAPLGACTRAGKEPEGGAAGFRHVRQRRACAVAAASRAAVRLDVARVHRPRRWWGQEDGGGPRRGRVRRRRDGAGPGRTGERRDGTGRDRAGRDGRDAGGTVSAARGRAGGGAQRLGARLFRHV